MPGVQHDARPVELAGRRARSGRSSRPHRRRRLEEEIKDELVAEYGPEDPRRAAEGGLRPAGLAAAARRASLAARSCSAAFAWRWSRGREPAPSNARLDPDVERRVDQELARFDESSVLEKIPVAFLAGFVSVITPCVLPLVPGYLSAVSAVEADRLGQPGRHGAWRSAAFRSSPGSRSSSSSSAPALRRSAACSPARQSELAGFVLVVLGLTFMGLLPWPERLLAPGLLPGARRAGSRVLLGGAFAVCAAPCIGTVLASILVLAGDRTPSCEGAVLLAAYSAGLGLAFLLAGRRVHAGDGRLPLATRPLQGDPRGGRADARRSRPASLLPPRLVAPGLPQRGSLN